MKIFTAVQTQWNEFKDAAIKYLSGKLGKDGGYGPSNIFGHIITVLNGMMQNLMLYIEDAFTEQNVQTAQRKKSIYSLAKLSGYEPSLGTAAKCNIKLIYNTKSGIESNVVVIPNKTKIISSQNGLTYNIILPQDFLSFDITKSSALKYMTVVEGVFETQEYTVAGGELYTQNVPISGDLDLDYTTVTVNGEKWTKVDSIYDMDPESKGGKQYFITNSLEKGIDVTFGNGQYGKILKDGDVVSIEVLSHNGESGNINPDDDNNFKFSSSIQDASGSEIDGNDIFNIVLDGRTGITNGTYSESVDNVRKMIGYNSRSLVLADAKNYKIFFNKFSFVGYNRCWSETGCLAVNALVMKNYKQLCENGSDYFNLNDDDFILSDIQKQSLTEAVVESGQQIGGAVINFIDPIVKNYAMYVYIKMKSNVIYDEDIIRTNIKNLIGEFFGDITSDVYIPKSDIIHLIKTNIPQIDGINIYIISQDNEEAKHNRYYVEKKYVYDPLTMTYSIVTSTVSVPAGTDPHFGLDDHGNILLENDMYFPRLKGNWSYYTITSDNPETDTSVLITDPVQIIFQ